MIQQQDQSDPIKFEVHMYHPTAMANAVTLQVGFIHYMYIHHQVYYKETTHLDWKLHSF